MNLKNTQAGKEPNGRTILIVDDHAIVREGLALLINQEPDLRVCAAVENAAEALEAIENERTDLAIIDISLEGTDGIELTEKIKSQYPYLPVLILTMHDEALYAKQAFRAGAAGYITKHEAAETIIAGIRMMLSGKEYISESITQKLLKKMHSKGSHC
jgi:DNA-binding NarL/FixJ family response regulator